MLECLQEVHVQDQITVIHVVNRNLNPEWTDEVTTVVTQQQVEENGHVDVLSCNDSIWVHP